MNSMYKYLLLAVVALAVSVSPALAEDPASPAAAPNQAAVVAQAQEDLSLYGEIQAVDAQAKTITVQYYDYDADEEKAISIACDSLTKFENAASVADMKKGDWADVTYILKDGKSLAKAIVLEKEEAAVDTPQAPTVEIPDVPEPGVDQE